MKARERLQIVRQKMPEQAAQLRACNFSEVNLGLFTEAARMEADRCLQCSNSKCVSGCPVGVNIPDFIKALSEGDLAKAAEILYSANVLPGVTGRVCPQETQCESRCVRDQKKGDVKKDEPVAIGYLERFVADWARDNLDKAVAIQKSSGRKVAVVGSGPAGLTCAGELAKKGHSVTIFEALHRAGGVLLYGIPEFRLPKAIVDKEVQTLRELGVRIECNVVIGQTYTIPELLSDEGFDAVFIANGAGLPVFLNIPGEGLKGVYSANEYLTRINLMGAYKQNGEVDTPVKRAPSVVVAGGGNTAMDAVRTARRLGASPALLMYRRSRAEMPARAEEVKHAEEEGVEFEFLVNPIEILGDDKGWVRAVRCERMELGEPDASGRRRPVPIVGSEFEVPCEVFIEAIGTQANPLLTQTTDGLVVNKRGYIEVDDNLMSSIPGVFAGGDIVRGAATVILAMGDGKKAAVAIDKYLS